ASVALLRCYVGDTAEQRDVLSQHAEHAPLHPAQFLLSVIDQSVGTTGDEGWALDFVSAEGVGEGASLQLYAQLELFGLLWRQRFTRVGVAHAHGLARL